MSGKPKTKDRLLKAACVVFAEKGFRDATVAEICEVAEANIAAVNYYFGGKEALYDRVWRHAFSITAEAYPLDQGIEENATPEDYLHAFASAILHRIFSDDENGLFAKLLYREMAAPSLALEKIAEEALLLQSRHVGAIVKKILGEDVDEQTLLLCEHNIIGQCAFYNFSRPLRACVATEEEIDRIARHIARFSLGGLQEIKNTPRKDAEAAE